MSLYFHLSKTEVKKGQVIKKGTPIGRIGSTGRSTGPHLHFQLQRGGKTYNPAKLIGKKSNKIK